MSTFMKRTHSVEVNEEQAKLLEDLFQETKDRLEDLEYDTETITDDFYAVLNIRKTEVKMALMKANFPEDFIDQMLKHYAAAVRIDVEILVNGGERYVENLLSKDKKVAQIEELHYGN